MTKLWADCTLTALVVLSFMLFALKFIGRVTWEKDYKVNKLISTLNIHISIISSYIRIKTCKQDSIYIFNSRK